MTTESRNDSNIDAAVKEVADLKQSLEQMAKEKAELGSTVDRQAKIYPLLAAVDFPPGCIVFLSYILLVLG